MTTPRENRRQLAAAILRRPDIHGLDDETQRCLRRLAEHSVHCRRCGKDLNDEESRALGIGRECWAALTPEAGAVLRGAALVAIASVDAAAAPGAIAEIADRVRATAKRRVQRELSIAAGLPTRKRGRLVLPTERERQEARRRLDAIRSTTRRDNDDQS